MYTIEDIKELREKTEMSIGDIKNALVEAGNDKAKALEILQKRGAEIMAKKAERTAKQGLIDCYVHQGRTGVLVEVNSETDFVARNADFKSFVHDISLQIASMKPENIEELLEQEYIKDPSKKISDLLKETIAKIGEKIVIKRFVKFELGKEE